MEILLKGAATVLLAYSAHYGVAKLYNEFCVPDGFWGYVQGMVTTGSPVCAAGLEAMKHTQVSYSTMILMGVARLAVDMAVPGAGAAIPDPTKGE
jgi:hypothetical protein